MNKKIYITISILISAVILFIVADYYSMFGVKQVEKFDFTEINFNTVDEESGAPVEGVKVRCFQKNNNNACTQRDSGQISIVSINVPVQKIVTQSILFEQDVEIKKTKDPKIHVMFIHQDYANPVETIFVEELLELKDKNIIVKMPKSIRNQ
jgi:hypothetical protein